MDEGCMLELAPPPDIDPRPPMLGLRKDFAAAAAAAADGFLGDGGTVLLFIPGCPTSEGTEGVADGGRPP